MLGVRPGVLGCLLFGLMGPITGMIWLMAFTHKGLKRLSLGSSWGLSIDSIGFLMLNSFI